MEPALIDAARVIIVVIFWTALAHPVATGTFWKWWRTDFGGSLMLKDLLIAAAVSPGALSAMAGVDVSGVAWLWYTVAALGLIPPVIWWRTWVLWREQRAGRSLNPAVAVREWRVARRAAAAAGTMVPNGKGGPT